jgi:hypothetical protein
LRAFLLRDKNNQPDAMWAIVRDITERKHAELLLEKNQELLKEAQRLGHLGSWELDLVRGELRWSDEVYRILEADPRVSPSYENFLNVVHPEDRDRVNQAYTRSLETRQSYDIVHRLLFADGRIKWLRGHCRTDFDGSGKPLRSVGAVQDITAEKLAEAEIVKAGEKFRIFFESISDAVFTIRPASAWAIPGKNCCSWALLILIRPNFRRKYRNESGNYRKRVFSFSSPPTCARMARSFQLN